MFHVEHFSIVKYRAGPYLPTVFDTAQSSNLRCPLPPSYEEGAKKVAAYAAVLICPRGGDGGRRLESPLPPLPQRGSKRFAPLCGAIFKKAARSAVSLLKGSLS